MIATLRLLPVLMRRAPRQATGAIALCAVGVAVATLVAGTVISAYVGLGNRADRLVWREPAAAAAGEQVTALQRHSTDFFQGQRIDRVDLAAAPPNEAGLAQVPTPPGARRAPDPGTAWVSPALAKLIESHKGTELGDRFGKVVGVIGPVGLISPDELLAITGATTEALGPAVAPERIIPPERRMPGGPSPTVAISGLRMSGTDRTLELYRDLALVAVVLVSVPALLLVGSAARLTAARREQRLAAIRLAGATPGSVRALAAAETSIGAAVGAIVGVGSAVLMTPLLHNVEIAGGTWFPGDLRLPLPAALGLTFASIAICMVATLFSLRRVSTSPLGVRRSAEPQRARWPRVLGLLGAIAGLGVTTLAAAKNGSTISMIAALGVVIASLALVGPWITALIGHAMTFVARRTPMLVAGRRITDDPRAAYRLVSSVVMAGLVAGFLAGVLPSAQARAASLGESDEIAMHLTVAAARALADQADSLSRRFPGTQINAVGALDGLSASRDANPLDDGSDFSVYVHGRLGPGTSLEELRTATQPIRQGSPLLTSSDDVFGDQMLVSDIQRAALAVLLAGLVLAAASSGIAAAASIVDQRRTIARLTLSGMPIALMQRARLWQSVLPLVAATAGAVSLGVFSGVMLMVGFGAKSDDIVAPRMLQLAMVIVAAAVMGLASASLTRPLLVNAARSGANDTPS